MYIGSANYWKDVEPFVDSNPSSASEIARRAGIGSAKAAMGLKYAVYRHVIVETFAYDKGSCCPRSFYSRRLGEYPR